MNVELEKMFMKLSGQNADDLAANVISRDDKIQIKIAFDEMFSGLSLLEWMQNNTLANAWNIAMNKLCQYIFSIPGQGLIMEYLHQAAFDFKKQTLRNLQSSLHANEFIQYPATEFPKLEKMANNKIDTGVNIIKSLLAKSTYVKDVKYKANTTTKENDLQLVKEKEYEREREYERVKK